MKIESTRLRWVKASELDLITGVVESFPHKVEIKGNPVKDGNKWVLFFTIPDESDLKSFEID